MNEQLPKDSANNTAVSLDSLAADGKGKKYDIHDIIQTTMQEVEAELAQQDEINRQRDAWNRGPGSGKSKSSKKRY